MDEKRGEVSFLEGLWEVAACSEEVGNVWRKGGVVVASRRF